MTKFKSSAFVVGLMGLAAASGAGCMDGETGEDGEAQPAPIAILDTASGAHVDFYEPFRGVLVVVATGELPDGIEGKTPVELYERLAAQPAPAVLRVTQERIAVARALRPPVEPTDLGPVAAPARSPISNLTSADFMASYCSPGAVSFDFCWTNRTGDYSTDISGVNWIHSHVNAYSGQVTHRMQIKHPPFGSWSVINTDTPTGSSYVSTFSEIDNGTYRVEILQASGDAYHLSIHGDK